MTTLTLMLTRKGTWQNFSVIAPFVFPQHYHHLSISSARVTFCFVLFFLTIYRFFCPCVRRQHQQKKNYKKNSGDDIEKCLWLSWFNFFFFNFFMLNEENAYFEALLSYKPVWVLSITFLFSVWMYLCENVLAH